MTQRLMYWLSYLGQVKLVVYENVALIQILNVLLLPTKQKKATNQRIKPKKLNVVLLQEKEDKVPKGKKRAGLNMSGRIKKLEFKRCMTADEVKNIISNGFSNYEVQKIQFLCCGQDNTLLKYENQDLNGDGIIDLAGQGSVYLLQVAICT